MAHDMGEMSEGVNRTFGGARGKRKKKKKEEACTYLLYGMEMRDGNSYVNNTP